MKKVINNSLNVLKAFSAFGVIYLHCNMTSYGTLATIGHGFMRFAVPIFFLISGFYSYYENNAQAIDKYEKRIMKLIKLLIVSNLLYLILMNLNFDFNLILVNKESFYRIIVNSSSLIYKWIIFCYPGLPEVRHLWFIQSLIYCYVFIWTMSKFKIKPNKLYIYIPILLLTNIMLGEISIYLGTTIPDEIYYSNFLFTGLPFFMIGYLINDKQDLIKNIMSNKIIIYLLIISLCFLVLEIVVIGLIDLYIGTILLSILIFIWCVKNPNKLNSKILGWIGWKIYGYIYILHILVIEVLKHFSINLGIINPLIVFIITSIISFIVYIILKKMTTITKHITI